MINSEINRKLHWQFMTNLLIKWAEALIVLDVQGQWLDLERWWSNCSSQINVHVPLVNTMVWPINWRGGDKGLTKRRILVTMILERDFTASWKCYLLSASSYLQASKSLCIILCVIWNLFSKESLDLMVSQSIEIITIEHAWN